MNPIKYADFKILIENYRKENEWIQSMKSELTQKKITPSSSEKPKIESTTSELKDSNKYSKRVKIEDDEYQNEDFEDDSSESKMSSDRRGSYFIKSTKPLPNRLEEVKKREDMTKFDFKSFIVKQATRQINDPIKLFDHLQKTIPSAKLIKGASSAKNLISIKLDRSSSMSGTGMIWDPKFSTNGQTLTAKINYDVDDVEDTIEQLLQSSASLPSEYYLTTTSLQTLPMNYSHHLPGWDGIAPVWLPSREGSLQLVDEENKYCDYPTSFLIFPAASNDDIYHIIKKSLESYHLKLLCNVKVMGGIPILNLACLQGDAKVTCMVLSAVYVTNIIYLMSLI